jgi:hypothetical protein
MADTRNPFDDLPPEQREHLRAINRSLQYEKLTVSFSIEGRDLNGNKKSAFYCVTASRGHGGETSQLGTASGESVAYNDVDAKLAHCLVSKHVVTETYLDAVRRGILSAGSAKEEMVPILRGYDDRIVKLLQGKDNG